MFLLTMSSCFSDYHHCHAHLHPSSLEFCTFEMSKVVRRHWQQWRVCGVRKFLRSMSPRKEIIVTAFLKNILTSDGSPEDIGNGWDDPHLHTRFDNLTYHREEVPCIFHSSVTFPSR